LESFEARANRIPAVVIAQPVAWSQEMRDPKYPGRFWDGWGRAITAKRPEITMQTANQFVTQMFETNPDFVWTVTRDFVRDCQTPVAGSAGRQTSAPI